MQQTNFGRDYGFSVLGISRHGQTIQERPSATRLEYGDSLLLLGHIHLQSAGTNLILCALLALTVALTQLIENAAVAIILAPIAYQIAREGHADPKPFMVALAICISTSFCTPVAHETTMLVMGPDRYRFKHYLSIGSGMAVIAWLLTTFVTPLVWRF